jgi:hypothetical protein
MKPLILLIPAATMIVVCLIVLWNTLAKIAQDNEPTDFLKIYIKNK